MYGCDDIVVGICSCCGGEVTVPKVWMATIPPTPTCVRCGAVARQTVLPIIETVPVKYWTSTTINSTCDNAQFNEKIEDLLKLTKLTSVSK